MRPLTFLQESFAQINFHGFENDMESLICIVIVLRCEDGFFGSERFFFGSAFGSSHSSCFLHLVKTFLGFEDSLRWLWSCTTEFVDVALFTIYSN